MGMESKTAERFCTRLLEALKDGDWPTVEKASKALTIYEGKPASDDITDFADEKD